MYIGKTTCGIYNRLKGHMSDYGDVLKSKFLHSYDTFEVYIMDECSSEIECDVKEKKRIREYCRGLYNNMTGLSTNYQSYSEYRNMLQPWILNENLY